MIFIPAIDLKGGKCVRLLQGDERREKVYFDDPVDVAKDFKKKGVRLIHVVDLDGAISGKQLNISKIEGILSLGIDIQLGGGIRSFERGRMWLELGVKRIIVSTMFYHNPGELLKLINAYGERVWMAIDVRDGRLSVKGWKENTNMDAVDAASRAEDMGVGGIVYTDISRDGMETGPDFYGASKVKDAVNIPVILSGGVRSLDDIRKAKEMGFYGIISGKAIYEKRFSIEDAIRIAYG